MSTHKTPHLIAYNKTWGLPVASNFVIFFFEKNIQQLVELMSQLDKLAPENVIFYFQIHIHHIEYHHSRIQLRFPRIENGKLQIYMPKQSCLVLDLLSLFFLCTYILLK